MIHGTIEKDNMLLSEIISTPDNKKTDHVVGDNRCQQLQISTELERAHLSTLSYTRVLTEN